MGDLAVTHHTEMIARRETPHPIELLALVGGLTALTVLLLFVRYVPFQDFPQHLHALLVDEVISRDGPTPHYGPLPLSNQGTFLFSVLTRAMRPLLGTEMAVRAVLAVTVIGFPCAVARLGGELGAPPVRAGLLAMPFALSWPVCMGLLPYALGLDCACFALAATLAVRKRQSLRTVLGLAFWLTLAFAGHTFAFIVGIALCGTLLVAHALTSRRARIPMIILLMIAAILAAPRFREAIAYVVKQRGTSLPRNELMGLLTLSYTATTFAHLAAVVPHAVLITSCAVSTFFRRPRLPRLPIVAVLVVAVLMATLLPERLPHIFYTGSRIAVLVGAILAASAARCAFLSTSKGSALAVAAVLLAGGWSFADVLGRSHDVEVEIGAQPPRNVTGRVLPVRVLQCPEPAERQDQYDHTMHSWTYALQPDSVSPYLFAGVRFNAPYLPIVLLNKNLEPGFPSERRTLLRLGVDRCAELGRARVLSASTWPGYDRVLASGPPAALDEALTETRLGSVQRIAPGLAVLPGSSATSLIAYAKMAMWEMAHVRLKGSWGGASVTGDRLGRAARSGARMVFQLPSPPESPPSLEITGLFPGSGELLVDLNGSTVGKVPLDPPGLIPWREYKFLVPTELLKGGDNELLFRTSEGALAHGAEVVFFLDELSVWRAVPR